MWNCGTLSGAAAPGERLLDIEMAGRFTARGVVRVRCRFTPGVDLDTIEYGSDTEAAGVVVPATSGVGTGSVGTLGLVEVLTLDVVVV